MRALGDDTLSPKRAEIGIGDHERKPSGSANSAKVGDDVAEYGLVEVDEIDLVDRQHDMADAEQRDDDRMAVRLRQQALARVDQHDREIGVGGAGRHVAGVLLMARRVGDDERALVGGEIAIGDIDRDALLALGLEAVDQQREVDFLAGRAVLLRVALQRGELIVEDQLLSRRAAGRSASTCRRRRSRRSGSEGVGQDVSRSASSALTIHQKYPSRFFFSIEPASSVSISRPWRSEVVEASASRR